VGKAVRRQEVGSLCGQWSAETGTLAVKVVIALPYSHLKRNTTTDLLAKQSGKLNLTSGTSSQSLIRGHFIRSYWLPSLLVLTLSSATAKA
jgi:hypothetical protein